MKKTPAPPKVAARVRLAELKAAKATRAADVKKRMAVSAKGRFKSAKKAWKAARKAARRSAKFAKHALKNLETIKSRSKTKMISPALKAKRPSVPSRKRKHPATSSITQTSSLTAPPSEQPSVQSTVEIPGSISS